MESSDTIQRHAAWFHELDAWTEYWDIYHPESHGRYYFGDGDREPGLLTGILPHQRRPPAFQAWTRMVLADEPVTDFLTYVTQPSVAAGVMEVDDLVARLFEKYFGDASQPEVRADYLEAMLSFAIDALPPAYERRWRIADDDWRKHTAGRHTLDSDIMWFAWALQLQAARAIAGLDRQHSRRALQLAGVAVGCSANFAWRGHRRTRPEYRRSLATLDRLRLLGMQWAIDFEAAATEVRCLFRLREFGHE